MKTHEAVRYSRHHRWIALVYGITTHGLFLIAVASMAIGLYTGMKLGRGRLQGGAAVTGNFLLMIQFPVIHSWLLTPRGRGFLARLAPANLGRPLATTSFAAISSLQLIICFLCWSPSGRMIFRPGLSLQAAMSVMYAGAWVLLGKSMHEAGLRLQTGSLGWLSIWKNRKPDYPGMPNGPLHKVIRQPIYASFALILWFAPSFTLEKVMLAVLWSAYCVVGSSLKEQRFARFYGEAFHAYKKRVPFWVPRLRSKLSMIPPDIKALDADVLIVGGGPVGLLLANLLGKASRTVVLLETRSFPPTCSMAIGITPPSLDILAGIGLDRACIENGRPIRRAKVHENRALVGELLLERHHDAYPFILSLPQSMTMALLRENLKKWQDVSISDGWCATSITHHNSYVEITAHHDATGISRSFFACMAAGCDGAKGLMAAWAGIKKSTRKYAPKFCMMDYVDRGELGDDACLFFNHERPVESFPLPGGARRWIVRCGWHDRYDLDDSFEQVVERLTGVTLDGADRISESEFQPGRSLARSFYRGRIALCGDAAHVMSPIGGQGMNTGFSDAFVLAHAMNKALESGDHPEKYFRHYHRVRRSAFRIAAARAALGMQLGIAKSPLTSYFRRQLIRFLLSLPAARRRVVEWFTMRSLPDPRQQAQQL
ncbi:MAG TPA: FAD-dependent monooxygenase [Kiritimatiellia bacterium]|nr:FAD-dependent monooxygenase [Kiritimatiellia bacterium]